MGACRRRREMTANHYFDGRDSREVYPPPPPKESRSSSLMAAAVSRVARAAWYGDQLVIVTHQTMRVFWPLQEPGEFERENTFRDALSLNGDGRLVIEGVAIIDPFPGGVPARFDIPSSGTCAYTKEP
jgi:hypothetical protein